MQAFDRQVGNVERTDPGISNSQSFHGKAGNRQGTNRHCSQRQRANRLGPDGQGTGSNAFHSEAFSQSGTILQSCQHLSNHRLFSHSCLQRLP